MGRNRPRIEMDLWDADLGDYVETIETLNSERGKDYIDVIESLFEITDG